MRKQAENEQNDRYRSEQRQIHKAMTQDTPVKTIHNSAYIDDIIAYDKEIQRISKAVCYKLDLSQNSLLGAQMYNTARPATAIVYLTKIFSKAYML